MLLLENESRKNIIYKYFTHRIPLRLNSPRLSTNLPPQYRDQTSGNINFPYQIPNTPARNPSIMCTLRITTYDCDECGKWICCKTENEPCGRFGRGLLCQPNPVSGKDKMKASSCYVCVERKRKEEEDKKKNKKDDKK